MMNGFVVQISAFGPVHETGSVVITPTIVCDTPSSVSARPITFGSLPNRAFQKRSVITATSAPSSSSGKNVRPRIARRPSTSNQFAVVLKIGTWNGSPSAVTVAAPPPSAANPSKMVCPSRKCMKRGAESGKSTVCSLKCEKTWRTRAGSLNGSPFRNRSLISEKIAVFSPIPSVRVITARSVNPGDLRSCRRAKRRSVII